VSKLRSYTKEEVANIIEDFLEGKGRDWDWDDFCTFPIADPELDRIRQRCVQLPEEFPPEHPGSYSGPEGLRVLQLYVKQLREANA
jgi:hypothetical protein